MKKLRNKTLLGFILGLIVASGIGVVAASIYATDIKYTKEDNTEVTVQKAIDDLYKMVSSSSIQEIGNATGATINKTATDEDGNLVGETYYAEVYLDPTDLTRECNATNSAINIGKTDQKTGCMKWYAFTATQENGKTKYDLILDHNSTALVPWANQIDYLAAGGTVEEWSAKEYNMYGPVTVVKELGKLIVNTSNGGYGWKVMPRMITADEIAHIVGTDKNDALKWKSSNIYGTNIENNQSSWFYLDGGRNTNKTSYSNVDGWQKKFVTTGDSSNYWWLYDYIYKCTGDTTEYGCHATDDNKYTVANSTSTNFIYGYWTSTKPTGTNSTVWNIGRYGRLIDTYANIETLGLRPVITITK